MEKWIDSIIEALQNLNGLAKYEQLYEEVSKIRGENLPETWKAIIRGTIEAHSSDSKRFNGKKDLFFSYSLGSGIWGLREYFPDEPNNKVEFEYRDQNENEPGRRREIVERVIRNSTLVKSLKFLHENRCQICGVAVEIGNEEFYSEGHHIRPLGNPHNGPDISENIIILCPNHHVMCDYGAIPLIRNELRLHSFHELSSKFIDYHNQSIFQND